MISLKENYKYIFIVLFIFLLSGCIPKGGNYYKFNYKKESNEYFRTACYGQDGPPSILFFNYQGIYLSIRIIEYSEKILLGIHIPQGNTVQVLNNELLFYKKDSKDFLVLNLKPTKHYTSGSSSPRIFRTEDPYAKEDFFNILSGDTKIISFKWIGNDVFAYKWYQFYTSFKKTESGIIKLPNLNINGKIYTGPELKFGKEIYFQPLGAFNC